MKIVILDGATVNPGDLTWEEVSALGDIRIYGRTPQEKVIEIIGDADVVFLLPPKTVVSSQISKNKPARRALSNASGGYFSMM